MHKFEIGSVIKDDWYEICFIADTPRNLYKFCGSWLDISGVITSSAFDEGAMLYTNIFVKDKKRR